MPLTRAFPTEEQAEAIRSATAKAATDFPDRAAQLHVIEAAVLTRIGDGLPAPAFESLVELIRSGLPAGDDGDETWES